ncbi:hypothetical protein M9Y10_024472 [Tritrichomonas musculus]|uniref:Uncharacterized protein n=1 Tax=Tritrichomonas musculus TaxID=1915356 RepID=A0ABR2HC18_9EUKA
MNDYIEEEDKSESGSCQNSQKALIAAGLINANSPQNYIPSPSTIFEVENLTRRMGRVHIATPNSSENSQIIETSIDDSFINSPEFHPGQQKMELQISTILNDIPIKSMETQYNRRKKINNIRLHFDDFMNSFSDKEWDDGIRIERFRISFQNYFHFPISNSGIGQLKEVKEKLLTRRKTINGKQVMVYKKR